MSRFFLPPVNRAMTTLDRSFFQRTFPITAAHVFDAKDVGRVQRECLEDVLTGFRSVKSVTSKEDSTGKKRMLVRLKPNVKYDDISTASEKMREFVKSRILELVPHKLHLTYENWGYDDIVEAILPEELVDGYPTSFTRAGHVVQLNLQSKFLPYKHILATIILDKHPGVTAVVNKLEAVGSLSDFRTFPMELLAGSPNTKVVVHESNCEFSFDFAKVYWNSRLLEERKRMIGLFKPGEAVADVMSGVGPFAIPAAKNKILVWANDINPDAYRGLKESISINKVNNIVQPFNLDAREFIRTSIRHLLTLSRSSSLLKNSIELPRNNQYSDNMQAKLRSLGKSEDEINPPPVYIRRPPIFSHFIMNNPSTAASYLDSFIGAYHGLEHLYFNTDNSIKRELPLVHLYIFEKPLGAEITERHICKTISQGLRHKFKPEHLEHLEHIRMVGPEKCYYCASFRLPAEVMFADVPTLPEGRVDENMMAKTWLKWSQGDDIAPPKRVIRRVYQGPKYQNILEYRNPRLQGGAYKPRGSSH